MAAIKKFLNPCGDPIIDKLNELIDEVNALQQLPSTSYEQPTVDPSKIDVGS